MRDGNLFMKISMSEQFLRFNSKSHSQILELLMIRYANILQYTDFKMLNKSALDLLFIIFIENLLQIES